MNRESKLDEILNSIRTNALDLSRSGYSDIQMIRTAVNRGGRLLKGQIKEQDVIDIGAIGLALLLRKIPE
mgnify:CR=1 FL=1